MESPAARAVPLLLVILGLMMTSSLGWAFSGTEGASFLDIPMGARPAALGGAYSALANDAYAPTVNPAGLGFLQTSQFAVMHLSYLDAMSYEFASLVHPFSGGHSIGASVQNLRPGRVRSTDINGNSIGDFSGSFFAYSLGFGQSIGRVFSIGLAGKIIQSKIADFSANGYAGDFGVMLRPSKTVGLSAVVANVGPKMTFLEDGDSLPSSLRVGGFYSPFHGWLISLQGTHARTGFNSGQSGVEWSPGTFVSLRAGYKTETTRAIHSAAGVTAGIGLHWGGQQFDYAWAPMGDLGNTQYFSLLFQWGEQKNLSAGEDRLIVFKEKIEEEEDEDDLRFPQENMSLEIQDRGLHP